MRIIRMALLGLLAVCMLAPAYAKTIYVVADEFEQMKVLDAFLKRESNLELQLFEQKDFPRKIPREAAGVIEFVHRQLDDDVAAAIMEYTLNGGRTVVIHHGISSGKKKTKGWYDFLGVNLDQNKAIANTYYWLHDVDFSFVNLQPRHYVTSHNVEYEKKIAYTPSDQPSEAKEYPSIRFIQSEVFVNHQFTDGREKTVLFGFQFTHPDTGEVIAQDRSGWYKKKGDGWVFYMHPGHRVEDFQHDSYCQILMNCFTWKP
jgi:hypothetical protein